VVYDSVLVIAVASTIASVGYALIGGGFGDGADSADGVDSLDGTESSTSWNILQFLSIQFLLMVVMSFSWSWLYWRETGSAPAFQFLGTLVTGIILTSLYYFGMKGIRKLNSPDRQKGFKPRPGMSGRVYVRIPECREGIGIVTFLDPVLGDVEMNAITDEETTIANGKTVVITDVEETRVVVRSA